MLLGRIAEEDRRMFGSDNGGADFCDADFGMSVSYAFFEWIVF